MLNLCLLPGKQKKSGRKPRKRLLQYDNAETLNKQTSQVTTTHTAPQLLGTDDRVEHISHFSFSSQFQKDFCMYFFLTSQKFDSENEHTWKWEIAFGCDSKTSSPLQWK